MKIRIASALTKPVITERDTNRITTRAAAPGHDLDQPGQHRCGQQVLQPVVRTSVTISTAVAAVAAEIMPGLPPVMAT
jgi:hypothetical protein